MNEHHKVLVVRVEQINPHPNADRLEIIPILGYQAISAKGQFKVGDLAYYVPPDSIVPETKDFEFLWLPNTYEGGVPEKKRRIAARRLRKEWSEGLLMRVESEGTNPEYDMAGAGSELRYTATRYFVVNTDGKRLTVKPDDDVSKFLGITHYDPPEPGEQHVGGSGKKTVYPRTLRGWFQFIKAWLRGERRERGPKVPVYDVKALKHFFRAFTEEDKVVVTEKIHGSNARYAVEKNLLGKTKFYAGSKNLWKAPSSGCVWREAARQNPWIEQWCQAHPGYALYGEVVSTKTQPPFNYGCKEGQVKFFLFDILTPERKWLDYAAAGELLSGTMAENPSAPFASLVPLLYVGSWKQETVRALVDGKTTVAGATHIREGVVIKSFVEKHVPGVGRLQLKWVSNDYLERQLKD